MRKDSDAREWIVKLCRARNVAPARDEVYVQSEVSRPKLHGSPPPRASDGFGARKPYFCRLRLPKAVSAKLIKLHLADVLITITSSL